jgi:hypothetical protein
MSTATTGNPPRAQAAQTGQTGLTPQQPRHRKHRFRLPRGRGRTSTPGTLRLLLITIVTQCLAWGALAAFTVSRHASAAGDVAASGETLSLDAQQIYRSLADADATTDTAYLNSSQEPAAAQQRYQADIARHHRAESGHGRERERRRLRQPGHARRPRDGRVLCLGAVPAAGGVPVSAAC